MDQKALRKKRNVVSYGLCLSVFVYVDVDVCFCVCLCFSLSVLRCAGVSVCMYVVCMLYVSHS